MVKDATSPLLEDKVRRLNCLSFKEAKMQKKVSFFTQKISADPDPEMKLSADPDPGNGHYPDPFRGSGYPHSSKSY